MYAILQLAADEGTVIVDLGDNVTAILLALIAGIPAIIAAFYAHRANAQAGKAAQSGSRVEQSVNGVLHEHIQDAKAAAHAEGKLEGITERRGATPAPPVVVVNPAPTPLVTDGTTSSETGVDNR